MVWSLLGLAILLETAATLALRMAVRAHRGWYVIVALGYSSSFWAFSVCLSKGLSLSVSYGIWAASGVALTAVASRLLFEEPFNRLMGAGIAVLACGVLLVETGASH